MFVLVPAVLACGFILFKWYWAVIGFAMFFWVLTPLCSLLFMPGPCPPHYINIIRRSLQNWMTTLARETKLEQRRPALCLTG